MQFMFFSPTNARDEIQPEAYERTLGHHRDTIGIIRRIKLFSVYHAAPVLLCRFCSTMYLEFLS